MQAEKKTSLQRLLFFFLTKTPWLKGSYVSIRLHLLCTKLLRKFIFRLLPKELLLPKQRNNFA